MRRHRRKKEDCSACKGIKGKGLRTGCHRREREDCNACKGIKGMPQERETEKWADLARETTLFQSKMVDLRD